MEFGQDRRMNSVRVLDLTEETKGKFRSITRSSSRYVLNTDIVGVVALHFHRAFPNQYNIHRPLRITLGKTHWICILRALSWEELPWIAL